MRGSLFVLIVMQMGENVKGDKDQKKLEVY